MEAECLETLEPIPRASAALRWMPHLAAGEVHLWSAQLSDPGGLWSSSATLLSSAELRKADSFRFALDRCRFIASRGLLRRLLAAYTGMSAASLDIQTDSNGKPFLAQPGADLHFNLSHSGGRALFAFASTGPAGVDLEDLASTRRVLSLIPSICSPAETGRLAAIPAEGRALALLRLWTAKEAFVKATGFGLQIPMHQLEVAASVMAGERRQSSVLCTDSPARYAPYRVLPLPDCERLLNASAALSVSWESPVRLSWFNLADVE